MVLSPYSPKIAGWELARFPDRYFIVEQLSNRKREGEERRGRERRKGEEGKEARRGQAKAKGPAVCLFTRGAGRVPQLPETPPSPRTQTHLFAVSPTETRAREQADLA